MEVHTTDTRPCELAEQYIGNNEIKPASDLMPGKSPQWYIPKSRIDALLGEEAAGVSLESLFLCSCGTCTRDGGTRDDRSANFNKLTEDELRTDYAAIYALLIYVHRPGLIRMFQRYELRLLETTYLQEQDFARLSKEKITGLESLKNRVLRDQYSFQVRTLKPYSDIKVIPSRELLPIREDSIPKGKGSFAEVRCFEFQLDEYRCPEFNQVSTLTISTHTRLIFETTDYEVCA